MKNTQPAWVRVQDQIRRIVVKLVLAGLFSTVVTVVIVNKTMNQSIDQDFLFTATQDRNE